MILVVIQFQVTTKKDGSTTTVKVFDPKTGKYENDVLQFLKWDANRVMKDLKDAEAQYDKLGKSATVFKATEKGADTDIRQIRIQKNKEYEKEKQNYLDAKALMKTSIMELVNDHDDNAYLDELVSQTEAMYKPEAGQSEAEKQKAIDYFYDELKENMEDFDNEYVVELIIMGYHEVLFGESFQKSERATRIRDNVRNGTQ